MKSILIMMLLLGSVSTLFSADQSPAAGQQREILQEIFGDELDAVAQLRGMELQKKKSEQFVRVMQWATEHGYNEEQANDLVQELEGYQEEQKQ